MDQQILWIGSMQRVMTVLTNIAVMSASRLVGHGGHQEGCLVKMGPNVTMSFSFPEDISNANAVNGFSVLRHHHKVLYDFEPVVDCFWFHPRNLHCLEKPDYRMESPVTDTVRIVIRNYTKEQHDGFYTCQVIPSEQFNINTCKLPPDLRGELTESATLPLSVNEARAQHESDQQGGEYNCGYEWEISTWVLVGIMLAAIVAYVFMIFKSRIKPSGKTKLYVDDEILDALRQLRSKAIRDPQTKTYVEAELPVCHEQAMLSVDKYQTHLRLKHPDYERTHSVQEEGLHEQVVRLHDNKPKEKEKVSTV